MEKKIVSAHRYKKVTRNSKLKKAKKLEKLRKQDIKLKRNKVKVNENKPKKNKVPKNSVGFNVLKLVVSISLLVLIGIASKHIVKLQNTPTVTVFSNDNEVVKLASNYDFKIGIKGAKTENLINSNNILENEILLKSNPSLVNITAEYNLEYVLIDSITKVNDLEYEIILKNDNKVKSENVKTTIDNIKSLGDKSNYYKNVKNIREVKIENDKTFKLILTDKSPYLVYYLNFPITATNDFGNLNNYELISNNDGVSKFVKNTNAQSKTTLDTFSITRYDVSDDLVSDFRDEKLDMFITSSYNVMQLIGKHEYNIKKYRNGENIFLFGNKDSILFSQKEIRQAMVYGINREEIIKNIMMSFGELIDVPYIYSDTRYKYDTYAANNILTSNGWEKSGGIYTKDINGSKRKTELSLLVNDKDNSKIEIADNIKEMLNNIGIKINVEKLSQADLEKRVSEKNYDLVLATVYTNENPDVNYIRNYLDINDNVNKAFEQVDNSEPKDIVNNIQNLQNVLYDEFACIGILAKDTNVVYQKYITGFESLKYMRIFENIDKIGKLVQ